MVDRSEVRQIIKQAELIINKIQAVQKIPHQRLQDALSFYEKCLSEIVWFQLDDMPVSELKKATSGSLRIGVLERSGYKQVGSILRSEDSISKLNGISQATAKQIVASSRNIKKALESSAIFRFDPRRKPKVQENLLGALLAYDEASVVITSKASEISKVANQVHDLLHVIAPAASWFNMIFASQKKKELISDSLKSLKNLLLSSSVKILINNISMISSQSDLFGARLWADYEKRPIYYYNILEKIGATKVSSDAAHGALLPEIAKKISSYPLSTSLMRASLRGYQAFGAKFALAQKRVLIADEMGLGKTVQALAAMADLASREKNRLHFIVVCPASVAVNWMREIKRHSSLHAIQLYGQERFNRYKRWLSEGGIAVVTFDGIKELVLREQLNINMLVVDEAHYIKNPGTQRSRAIAALAERTSHVLLLTGTPLINRLDELKSLINVLDKNIASRLDGPDVVGLQFAKLVSPIYLRREQKDVLLELPDRVDSFEWVNFDSVSLDAYKAALREGDFMKMRQAAFMSDKSTKLQRIVEIVNEAHDNGQNVVIFSYFISVLHIIHNMFGSRSVGIISGKVSSAERQRLVDALEEKSTPSVLVSQITSGGVGLNIQAASTVILAEPQWSPSVENQAIARCHRMGQKRTVMVYKILTENSVDQRMLEILREKEKLFDTYARKSELRDSNIEAIDISDMDAVQSVASQAQHEKFIINQEKIRLGIL